MGKSIYPRRGCYYHLHVLGLSKISLWKRVRQKLPGIFPADISHHPLMLLPALQVQDCARGESRDFVAAEQRLHKRAHNTYRFTQVEVVWNPLLAPAVG
jgi:hypothetical protein